jgi:cell division protein FtsZ
MNPKLLSFDPPKKSRNVVKIIGIGKEGINIVMYLNELCIGGVEMFTCDPDETLRSVKPKRKTKNAPGSHMENAGNDEADVNIPFSLSDRVNETRDILNNGSKLLIIIACFQETTDSVHSINYAKLSRESGILTLALIGITGTPAQQQRGTLMSPDVKQLEQVTDSMLLINFEIQSEFKSKSLNKDMNFGSWVLAQAAKSISELVTVVGYICMDFEYIRKVMQNSGLFVLGMGTASGPSRAIRATEEALRSPLLNGYNINESNDLLLYFSSGHEEITMDEVYEVTEFLKKSAAIPGDLLWGNGFDRTLGNAIRIIIFGTGITKCFTDRRVTPTISYLRQDRNHDGREELVV